MVKRDLRAKILLNNKPILLSKMPWTIELMHDRIAKTIGNDYLTSIYLGSVAKFYEDVSKSVISEFIDLISKQNIHPDGLNEIKFEWFERSLEDMDEGTFDSLVPFTKNLTKLNVGRMNQTSK